MKTKLLIISLASLMISCSSSKGITAEPAAEIAIEETLIKEKEALEKIASLKINNRINHIIQNYLGVPISSIARSDVEETNNGYQWKFMNVKTGENFIANSDFNFDSVKIIKNKRS